MCICYLHTTKLRVLHPRVQCAPQLSILAQCKKFISGLPPIWNFWKPGNVRELCKGQGKVRERHNVREKSGNVCSQGYLIVTPYTTSGTQLFKMDLDNFKNLLARQKVILGVSAQSPMAKGKVTDLQIMSL